MKNLLYLILLVFLIQCKPKKENTILEFAGKPEVPSSIKATHSYLLNQIHIMTLYNDSSGRAAMKLEDIMKHHFKEEEDFILPPLGLLPLLANHKIPEESKELIDLSEKVKSYMDHLSVEHQLIAAYLEELKQASAKENIPAIIIFESEVAHHAKSEEEVFFPAAILVGEYLKSKTAIKP